MLTDRQTDKKTDKQKDEIKPISTESYLGCRSISLSSLNLIGQSVLELQSGNRNVDGQTNGQKTDKQIYGITPISKGTKL